MSLNLQYEIVDAFTSTKFKGNPASVIILPIDSNLSDEVLQKIAAEFNLSETAFCSPLPLNEGDINEEDGEGKVLNLGLRWFTPAAEVKLCGHATLASSHVIFNANPLITKIKFQTLSGELIAEKSILNPGSIVLDFPADHSVLIPSNSLTPGNQQDGEYEKVLKEVLEATRREDLSGSSNLEGKVLGICKTSEFVGMGCIVELDSSVDLESLKVDFSAFSILTFTQAAPLESNYSIYSRFFGPGLGVPEDPVTGSMHAYLTPYWLGLSAPFSRLPSTSNSTSIPSSHSKTILKAKQVSSRSGEMNCYWNESLGRVKLEGKAVSVMRGVAL